MRGLFLVCAAILPIVWSGYWGLAKPAQFAMPHAVSARWHGRLHNGDLLFRRGNEAVSEVVLGLDPGSEYSHVGIVVFEGNQPMVVHAAPAEDRHERSIVKVEPVTRFLAFDRSSGMVVYRLKKAHLISTEAIMQLAAREALRLAKADTPFDSAFDLNTTDQLYCTELVWYVYRKVGIDLAPHPPNKRFLLWSGRYIPPSTLQASPLVERVCC